MRSFQFLAIVSLGIVLAATAVPNAAPAASVYTPRWLLHVQKYPGGLSNSVRAMASREVAESQARFARLPIVPELAATDTDNVQMNDDSWPPLPQNETSVALNVHDPMVAVAGANDYVSIGLALMRTEDGGRTWNTFRQTPMWIPTRDACTGGDPAVEYSVRDRAFYATTLCFFRAHPQSALQLWKSVDNGKTWTPSRFASVIVSNFDPATGKTDESFFYDKEYIAIDNNPSSPFFGRIYVTYVKFHFQPNGFSDYCPAQIAYTDRVPTSNPQLAEWTRVAVVPDNPGDDGKGPTANQWAYAHVEGDGDVDIIYAFEDCNTGLDRRIVFQKSRDGGRTFLPQAIRITKPGQFKDNPRLDDSLPPTIFRAPLSPAIDVNKKTGTLAIVYQNNLDRATSKANISVQLSRDGGMTWSDMQYISTTGEAPATNDQFFPWIDSDEEGNFFVIWFDRRDSASNRDIHTYMAVSGDDGRTWRNFRISSKEWNPNKAFFASGAFIGDYNGIAASNQAVYPVWTDGRNSSFDETGIGESDIFTRPMIGPAVTIGR